MTALDILSNMIPQQGTFSMKIAIVTISDRASKGEYEDKSGPAIEAWLRPVIASAWEPLFRVIPDGMESVRDALIELCDIDKADLILTTGGTGPSPRDLTPEAMKEVIEKELTGFGELMRRVSFEQVPTAILSRQTAGTRGKTLIVNVPGKPDSIKVCLDAVFPAVPYCLDLIGAGRIETNSDVLKAFRPKG
jgi:molybdopterin adenylyltransferase